jgi:hypothetical protein
MDFLDSKNNETSVKNKQELNQNGLHHASLYTPVPWFWKAPQYPSSCNWPILKGPQN